MTPEVINAIRNRHTTNLYDASRSLPDETIRELVDLATRAPSAFNLQNWRFLAMRSPEGKARLRQAAFNQAKVSETAVTFIMVGQLANHEVLPSRLAGSVAAGFMPEQVARVGWGPAAVAAAFDLAADEIPVLLVTVGYDAEGNWPQKPRRPIDEVLTLA